MGPDGHQQGTTQVFISFISSYLKIVLSSYYVQDHLPFFHYELYTQRIFTKLSNWEISLFITQDLNTLFLDLPGVDASDVLLPGVS